MYPYMYIDFISSLPLRLKILSSGPRKRFAPAAALGTTVVSQLNLQKWLRNLLALDIPSIDFKNDMPAFAILLYCIILYNIV